MLDASIILFFEIYSFRLMIRVSCLFFMENIIILYLFLLISTHRYVLEAKGYDISSPLRSCIQASFSSIVISPFK